MTTSHEVAIPARRITLACDLVVPTTDWLTTLDETRGMHVGYAGASTGAGAGLVASERL